MQLTVSLGANSAREAIKQLEDYKKSLSSKCEIFVNELAEHGISVAVDNSGKWKNYLIFTKDVSATAKGVKGYMAGEVGQYPISMWMRYDKVVSTEVNPLLMAEFGSGAKASDASGKPNAQNASKVGAGRGTFPNQTHADENSWSWMDLTGEWHSSSGEEPSMPMFNAYLSMKDEILKIARQVFTT